MSVLLCTMTVCEKSLIKMEKSYSIEQISGEEVVEWQIYAKLEMTIFKQKQKYSRH